VRYEGPANGIDAQAPVRGMRFGCGTAVMWSFMWTEDIITLEMVNDYADQSSLEKDCNKDCLHVARLTSESIKQITFPFSLGQQAFWAIARPSRHTTGALHLHRLHPNDRNRLLCPHATVLSNYKDACSPWSNTSKSR
jgi:hypothetical protein